MTTVPTQHDEIEALPRAISRRPTGGDRVFVHGFRAIGATVLVVTGSIGLFLAWQAVPTLRHYGLSFFTEEAWAPEQGTVGIAGILVGTVSVAGVALVIAFPLALLTALFISEYAPHSVRATLVSLVDLMAAVPSIVYGLWGRCSCSRTPRRSPAGSTARSAASRSSTSRAPTRTPRCGTRPATSPARSARRSPWR